MFSIKNHMNIKENRIDLGKLRSIQRVTTADGFFLICALDHLSDFQELLDPDPKTVDYQRTGEAKIELIGSLASECSAFLLDARLGLAHCLARSPRLCRADGQHRGRRL
jgi:tagatose-1,6-bisphosphate aldolase